MGAAEDAAALTARAESVAASLEEAARLLRLSMASEENVPPAVGGFADFEKVAVAYERRAEVYRAFLEAVKEELPKLPELTDIEQDAARILHVRKHVNVTSEKMLKHAEYLKKSTIETIAQAPAEAGESTNIFTSRCNGRADKMACC